MLEQDKEIDSSVPEHHHQRVFDADGVCIIGLAGIVDETPLSIGLFGLVQPGRGRRVVGQRDGREERDADGDAALDDEQPSPARDPVCPVQIPQHTRAYEAAKRVCQGAAGVKPGNSMAQLL